MAQASGRFEELDADFFADPYRAYRRWRERGTVHRVRFADGRSGWVITGYAEGRAALADPRLHKSGANARWFASGQRAPMSVSGQSLNTHMLDSDPPDHTRLRKLVNKAFTAGAVEALRPRIAEIVATLLDEMATHDDVDLIEAFAVPLPITVIGELLGVAVDDRAEFRRRTNTAFSAGANRAAVGQVMDFLAGLVQAKRDQAGEDILSALVQARDEGDRLTERELVATAFLLLFAGHETTVNLIGNGMYALLRNPDQLAALRAQPALVPNAVEELLRFDGPVCFATLRYTAEPVLIGDTEIPAGEFVHVALGAANRDPDRFSRPEQLDVTRDLTGHVAFGHGIHHCIGAPLARLEAQIGFAGLLHRFPHLRLGTQGQTLQWHEGFRIRGLISLPVRLR